MPLGSRLPSHEEVTRWASRAAETSHNDRKSLCNLLSFPRLRAEVFYRLSYFLFFLFVGWCLFWAFNAQTNQNFVIWCCLARNQCCEESSTTIFSVRPLPNSNTLFVASWSFQGLSIFYGMTKSSRLRSMRHTVVTTDIIPRQDLRSAYTLNSLRTNLFIILRWNFVRTTNKFVSTLWPLPWC